MGPLAGHDFSPRVGSSVGARGRHRGRARSARRRPTSDMWSARFAATAGALLVAGASMLPGAARGQAAPSLPAADSSAARADSLASAGPPLVFERCAPDTNLGCNPSAIPGLDTLLWAQSACGPVFVRGEPSDSSAGRVHVRRLCYTASDGCGNVAMCTRTLTWIEDRVVPVLPAFADTTLVHDPYRCTAALALPARAAKPGADSVAITYTPPPPFPIGVTRVVATAADDCGNAARDSFVVTVTAEICGSRFYDANGNGQNDDRAAIDDWPVTLVGTNVKGPVGPLTVKTGGDGRYCFDELLAGSYYVISARNAGTIGSAPDTVAFPRFGAEGACPATADLGEFCIGRGGGAPLASWNTASAQKLMSDKGGPIPELEELTALCLRNPDGTEFLPATMARFRAWLQAPDARNMAYSLSLQLAMLYLNVESGLVSGSAIVLADGCGNRGPRNNTILVNDLIASANAELCMHGRTVEPGPFRDRQERLRAALEGANADRGFLQKTPCVAVPGAPVEYHPPQRK